MAQAPPRSDLDEGSPFDPGAPTRPTISFGLAAALAWVLSGYVAHRGIGWYPPPTAVPILAAGVPVVLVLGLVIGRFSGAATRSVLGVVLGILSLLVPQLLATSVPGVAHPEQLPLPGRPAVSLTAAPEGNSELWLMNGDSGHVTRLTTTPAGEIGADLSPDGTRIIFGTDASGTWDLSMMTLGDDGGPGPIRSFTNRPDADEVSADWSPDGTQIAFTVDTGDRSEIWLADADGSDAHRIISDHAGAGSPSWSPDGTRIAFNARREDEPYDEDIWIADADGSDARVVIDLDHDQWRPFWSPDGTTLLFTSDATGDQDAWVCAVPCAEPHNLTVEPDATDRGSGWTPDGHAMVASDRLHLGGTFVYFVDDDGAMRLSLII